MQDYQIWQVGNLEWTEILSKYAKYPIKILCLRLLLNFYNDKQSLLQSLLQSQTASETLSRDLYFLKFHKFLELLNFFANMFTYFSQNNVTNFSWYKCFKKRYHSEMYLKSHLSNLGETVAVTSISFIVPTYMGEANTKLSVHK